MGRKINLIRIEGQCPRCRKAVDGYGLSPTDATNRYCPFCRQPLVLVTGQMVPAWEIETAKCLLLQHEPLLPLDVELCRQREQAIIKLGCGLADSLNIRSVAMPYGLVRLRTAVGKCFSCQDNRLVAYLTDWQRRRLVCEQCSAKLHLSHERELVAAPDGPRYWPLEQTISEVVYPFRRDRVGLETNIIQQFTEIELELLGLK